MPEILNVTVNVNEDEEEKQHISTTPQQIIALLKRNLKSDVLFETLLSLISNSDLDQHKQLKREIKRLKSRINRWEQQGKNLDPREYFRNLSDNAGNTTYTLFDEQGIPTHDKMGSKLSKKERKKLSKLFSKKQGRYELYQRTKIDLDVHAK